MVGYTTLRMYLMPLNCTFEDGKMILGYMYFTTKRIEYVSREDVSM